MPYNSGVRTGIGLVGRDDESAELMRFLTDGGPGALALRGDAGVGKTALTSEFARRAAADGWRVLRAIGVEAEKPFTLGGLNQMVLGLREELAALDEREQDVLAPAFGVDPVETPSPMALAVALLRLLGAAARDRPVLLLVDDVHWLDDLSAAVLSAAGRRTSDPRVRMVASYRGQPGAEFSSAGWAELVLGPLAAADSARIVDELAGSLSAGARRIILDVAAGNPLALEELPGCADELDEWTSVLPLTDRLVTVFGGRLAQLEPRVRAELLRAALDGTRAGSSADSRSRYAMVDVQSALDQELLTVNPMGDIVFRHPLVRAAVIHRASAAERRDAHAELARLYDDVLVRRATHLGAASTTPDQSVADLLDEAARLSIRRGGAAVAVDWLRRAAELSTDSARRSALRADAAFVASQSSRFDDAEALAESTTPGDEPVVSVLTGAYLALYRDGEAVPAHRRIVAALRAADSLEQPTLVRLTRLLLTVSMYAGDADLWRQTDDVVDRLRDRVDDVTLLHRDAWGDVARRGHTVRARLAEHLDTVSALEPWDVMQLAVTTYYVDDLADIRSTLVRWFERERDRGVVTNAMTMLHLLVLDQIGSGSWTLAEESVRLGRELTTTHRNDLFHYQFIAYDGLRAACAGDVHTARRCAAEVNGWAGPRRLGLLLGFALRIPVLTALAEGDYEAAYGAALRVGPMGRFPAYSHQATDALLDVVEAAVHSGQHVEARAHAEEAARLRLGEISPRLDALTVAVLAMTSPDEDAGAGYEKALAHAGLDGFPFEQNRIRLEYGMWLRRRRRTTAARDALTLAADGFDGLGARPWADRARTELRAAGSAVKRSGADGVTLSAQERTIAELAASGQSNKQIAAQLYLSPRTVGAHLYRIFPKLGVTSRAGLGQALRELEGG